ncbi:MAG: transcription antitermination factor NusB [Chloroflexi bacterium]|nr:transcription antitermination factor NusB [Chloroflexota bacterium]
MKPRTKARGVALQALYEIDITGHPVEIVLEERFKETPLESRLEEFTRSIVSSIEPMRDQLDTFIAEHAPEWPIDQVSTIDRNLLRIALWEFAVSENTPVKVAINEAIELAKKFGSDSTPRFVNGVLGSLVSRRNEIRQAILSIKSKQHSNSD